MKIKFLSYIFLLLLVPFNLSFAKPLPPGTGNSTPANILFLVDKSQSMHNSASGNIPNAMKPPTDVSGRWGGNYFVSAVDEGGVSYWDADQNKLASSNQVFKSQNTRIHGYKNRDLGSPVQIEHHAGTRRLYILADQRDMSHGNMCRVNHNGKNYNGGFILYQMETKISPGTKNNYKQGSVRSFHSNLISSENKGGFRSNCTTTKDAQGNRPASMSGNTAMAIHENKLYVVSSETPGEDKLGGMYIFDIVAGGNGFNKGKITCEFDLKIYKYFNESIDVVTEDGSIVMYSKDTTGKAGEAAIRRIVLNDGTTDPDKKGCLPPLSMMPPIYPTDKCGVGRGAASIVVKDRTIYTTGYFSHSVCKYHFPNKVAVADFKKKVGIGNAFTENKANNSQLYLYYPMGIDFGVGAADKDTLFVTNYGRLEITMLDPADLTYKDHFGDPGVSRFQGVKEAISYVLNDSATLQQANFGLGFWSGGNANFDGFLTVGGNIRYDKPKICKPDACMDIGINPKGAQQIQEKLARDDVHLLYNTNSKGFKNIIHRYYNVSTYPMTAYQSLDDCQINAIVIIGDGQFTDSKWGINDDTLKVIQGLAQKTPPVLTFAVGYGSDVINDNQAKTDFTDIAIYGGTETATTKGVYFAETPADLKNVTDNIVQAIISRNIVLSAPSIASEFKRDGELFQSNFTNRTNKEWTGTVKKFALPGLTEVWSANKVMPDPNNRKIWTALDGDTSINNFNDGNVGKIRNLFTLQGNVIQEYHRKTVGNYPVNLTHCSNVGKDGTIDDEDKGIINFVRGEDYFNYMNNCQTLKSKRMKPKKDDPNNLENGYLADIYNSSLLVIGPPNASMESSTNLTEAYFRKKKGYGNFKKDNSDRLEVVYAAANNGILHAFSTRDQGGYKKGEEIWGFVPPLIIPKMPRIINSGLNTGSGGGGTNPRFLLDGSPVAHDTYFEHPVHNKEGWYTLLMIPYGRAGAGFSLIDVTKLDQPLHLYSILNDTVSEKVHRVDHNGKVYSGSYSTSRINETNFKELQTAKINATQGLPNTCNTTGNTSCYKGKKITLAGQTLDTSNTSIALNGSVVTNSVTVNIVGANTEFTFQNDITFNANPGGVIDTISIVEVGSLPTGWEDYDYRYLGETWASPRVFRMPSGPGDRNVMDDEYVAVMGGGNGNFSPSIGSNLYIIDWLTGKVKKELKISDKNNDIINSVPATPVVVTADLSQEEYTGALVYVSDLEGKITKVNLSSLSGTFNVNQNTGNVQQIPPTTGSSTSLPTGIQLYQNYTFFDVEASTTTNNRYMYHALDAGIGVKSKKFWLFGGTGDYYNLNDSMLTTPYPVKNVMFGLKDPFFPGFGSAKSSTGSTIVETFADCVNRTDQANSTCPDIGDSGWFVELDDQKKVSAEPTLTGNVVYYPIYKPNRGFASSNTTGTQKCGSGTAYICAYDADCGDNISSLLGTNPSGQTDNCYYVGSGVLSKIIPFGAKLYANISGESTNVVKPDLVVIDSIDTGLINYRSSWRDNF